MLREVYKPLFGDTFTLLVISFASFLPRFEHNKSLDCRAPHLCSYNPALNSNAPVPVHPTILLK